MELINIPIKASTKNAGKQNAIKAAIPPNDVPVRFVASATNSVFEGGPGNDLQS